MNERKHLCGKQILKQTIMKKILLSVIAVAGLSTAQAQIPTSGLVEHFTFNSTLIGVNGSNLVSGADSAIGFANFVADKDGRASNAQLMDSSKFTFYKVAIANMPSAVNQTRSLAFWFKHSANTTHSFFNFTSPNGGGTSNIQSFYASYDQEKLYIGVVDSGQFSSSIDLSMPYNANWTHVAITFDGTAVNIYKNGSLFKSQVFTFPVVSATGKANFGRSPGGQYFGAFSLDEFVLYNRALSATEVTQLYQAVSPNSIGKVEKANFGVSVFPNPTSSDFVIETLAKNPSITVADMLGKVVYSQNDAKAATKVATERWANGVYLVSVESENQKSTQRLVINR
jgi:hypothetical protein